MRTPKATRPWHTIIKLVIALHPGLTPEQARAIATDYNIRGASASLPMRQALAVLRPQAAGPRRLGRRPTAARAAHRAAKPRRGEQENERKPADLERIAEFTLRHIQWKLNVLQLFAFVAFSDGKSVTTFPQNALRRGAGRRTPMTCLRTIAAMFCAAVMVCFFYEGGLAQKGRTIRLIVPVPPGASTDVIARLMAEHIGKTQGVTIVVENRPGAGRHDRDGVRLARRAGRQHAAADREHLSDRCPDAEGELQPGDRVRPVCLLVESPAVLAVNSASPYRSLKDLLDAARARPGELSMAAVGPGSTFQIGFINLTRAADVK